MRWTRAPRHTTRGPVFHAVEETSTSGKLVSNTYCGGTGYVEMEVLTGCTNPESAAKELAAWGVKEVVVTLGRLGSLIYAEGEFHRIPAYQPRQVVDATGCGDTYMSAYLYMRACGESCYRAGCFAAAMSTLKLERFGPFAGTEEQILDIIGR